MSGAVADSQGPITFDSSQGYTVGSINGQQGWSDTGGYDAQVVGTSVGDFGDQSLQISDASTSGSFGDQTFAPALAQSASEASNPYFTASFSIDTATGSPNDGLHMSVSPDNGQGGRMSYLRFEYRASDSKVHVFFDDSSQSSLCTPAGCASFSDTDIAQFEPGTVHTFTFAINLVPGMNSGGSPNDVVKIYEDGNSAPIHTGTTWEGYYRYDPESGPATPPPISTLLFREAGSANAADLGNGYLIDNLSTMSSSACAPTGLVRDGINLTAAQVGGTVNGSLNATGCNIGVYYGPGMTGGNVSGANISGANYYGVVVNAASANISNSSIHDIGEDPLNGSQHGVGVLYTTINQAGASTGTAASGTLSGTTITNYQKNGVVVTGTGASATVSGNTVTGQGQITSIAQNGIEIASGASAIIKGNTVTSNWYLGGTWTACGLLFYQAGGVKQQSNTVTANQTNVCNAGRGGGNFKP